MICDEVRDRIAGSAAAGAGFDDDAQRHLDECAACRAEVDDLRRAATLVRAAHVLEETRSRRAPFFAEAPRGSATRKLTRVALGVAIAAAVVIAVVLGTRSRPVAALTWSGDGEVVALSPGRARIASGSVRFEAVGSFEVATPLARLVGERATFTVTLEREGNSMHPSVKKVIVAGGGVAAVIAVVVFVESGSVDVHRSPSVPMQRIEAGEMQVITPPKVAPLLSREEREAVVTPAPVPSKEVAPPAASAEEPTDDLKRGSVHGVLVFDDGAPVADEFVWLWGTPHVVSKTDANGFFRIDRDWLSNMPRSLMVGPEGAANNVGKVVLVANEDREVRFTIPRGIDLDVLVTNEANAEVLPGIWVAMRCQDKRSGEQGEGGNAYGTTNDEGLVHFRHLARVKFLVEVRYTKGWRHYEEPLDLGASPIAQPHRVRLRAAEVLTIHVDGWSLGATADATVQLRPQLSGTFEDCFGKVDASGNFVTDAPLPGRYAAEFSCEGWALESAVFTVPEIGPVDVHVRVPAGEVVEGVIVAVPTSSSLSSHVHLRAAEGFENRDGTVDDAGNFRIEHVARGRYRVRIEFEDQEIVGSPDEIDVPAGGLGGLVIRLSGGSVSGRVIGAPESGLLQTAFEDDGRWTERGILRPDVDGSFRGRWLTPGRWRLTASRSRGGYASPVEVDVELDKETSGITIRWRACPTVEIVVRHADGLPLVGRQFAMLMPTTTRGWATNLDLALDDRGHATTNDIPPGSWKLHFNGCPDKPIDVVDGANAPIEVTVP
ncbi:MAG: carboxypeptidase regulatory-like domain-containing protein [Planctomycetes bacterium]|nr:carboxypeptidase regulatory-like domain-containing protein [Planctomycetota bacterium]MBI3844274.1 carboxypeptidase regulatory-like domain-containing protein [Planctomycetota bacterium]